MGRLARSGTSGVIDEKGKVLTGEELIYILAKYYLSENKIKKGSVIVTNEIANHGLDISLENLGLKLKRVKVGVISRLSIFNSNFDSCRIFIEALKHILISYIISYTNYMIVFLVFC